MFVKIKSKEGYCIVNSSHISAIVEDTTRANPKEPFSIIHFVSSLTILAPGLPLEIVLQVNNQILERKFPELQSEYEEK